MRRGKLTDAICNARAEALESAATHLGLSWTDDPVEFNEGQTIADRLLRDATMWRRKAHQLSRHADDPAPPH